MGICQLSSEVLVPIGEIILRTVPFIAIGVLFGWMIESWRAELFDHIHRAEMASFDRDAASLKMFEVISERLRYCMTIDRFEFVDVRKEENDRTS